MSSNDFDLVYLIECTEWTRVLSIATAIPRRRGSSRKILLCRSEETYEYVTMDLKTGFLSTIPESSFECGNVQLTCLSSVYLASITLEGDVIELKAPTHVQPYTKMEELVKLADEAWRRKVRQNAIKFLD